jgi:uncharacterized protein
MRIVRKSAFKAVPWKNGGGVTHEVLRVPESGERFDYRVSVARIDASGPFSDFTGYRRTMVLLRGAGLVLRFAGGESRELESVGDIARFDGATPVDCELSGGPCTDFNLMVSSTLGAEEAQVRPVDGPTTVTLSADETMLIFPIDAPLEVRTADEAAGLEPWDLAVLGVGGRTRRGGPADDGGLTGGGEAGARVGDAFEILPASAGSLVFVATLSTR